MFKDLVSRICTHFGIFHISILFIEAFIAQFLWEAGTIFFVVEAMNFKIASEDVAQRPYPGRSVPRKFTFLPSGEVVALLVRIILRSRLRGTCFTFHPALAKIGSTLPAASAVALILIQKRCPLKKS